MLVAWRDDGFWTLILLRCSLIWKRGRIDQLPGRGFVGRESSSFRDTGAKHARLRLTRMRRLRYISGARLWRLTLKWEAYPAFPQVPYGNGLAPGGR